MHATTTSFLSWSVRLGQVRKGLPRRRSCSGVVHAYLAGISKRHKSANIQTISFQIETYLSMDHSKRCNCHCTDGCSAFLMFLVLCHHDIWHRIYDHIHILALLAADYSRSDIIEGQFEASQPELAQVKPSPRCYCTPASPHTLSMIRRQFL